MRQWHARVSSVLLTAGLLMLGACQSTPDEEAAYDPEAQGVAERVRHYRGAVAKSPEDPVLYYRLGNALLDMGRYQEAYQTYQEAIRRKPDYADAFANLGLALRKMGNLKAATGAYIQALDLNPNDTQTLRNLATLAELSEDWDRMRWCYEKLTALNPDNLDDASTYAALLYGLEHYREAIPVYEGLIAAGREPDANGYRLGFCHFSLDQWRLAIESWEAARITAPENPSINRGLVAAYAALGDREATRTAAARCDNLGITLDAELQRQVNALTGNTR